MRKKHVNYITIEGLINVLDGIINGSQRRIIVMVANQIDNIPPVVTRRGRVDLTLFIDYANKQSIANITRSFFKDEPEEKIQEFVNLPLFNERKFPMVDVQNHLLRFDTIDQAIKNIDEIIAIN
jgi:hypothetical protein